MSKTSKKKSVKKTSNSKKTTKKATNKKTKETKNLIAKKEEKEKTKPNNNIQEEQQQQVKQYKLQYIEPEIKKGKDGVEEIEVYQTIPDRMGRYGMEIAVGRSLCNVIDGFKPSQLFWLYDMKLIGADKEKFVKSGTISGDVMGRLNPHGNSYGTGVRMVDSNETLLTPMIEGQGTFGKHFSKNESEAAERYTYMRLSKIGKEIIEESSNSKYHPNNMVENFDGTIKVPKYLSAPFPNVLANPQEGIALGIASTLGSFNLKELCDACIAYIENPKDTNKIYKVMPTMDFTTGALTYIDKEEIKNIYEKGKGIIKLRAVIENDAKNKLLLITQIPFSTYVEDIMSAILKGVETKKMPEVKDVRIENDIDGLKVAVDYKNGTNVDGLIEKLYALTPCQSNFYPNMYVVNNNRPELMGVFDCIEAWYQHRKQWVKEGLEGRLKEKEDYLHLLEGLEKILLDIDKAIKIVKQSKTDEEVISGLMKGFKIDEIQAEFVANIKLRNFNKDYILNKTKEIKEIKKEIDEIKKKLKNINQVIIDDLERVKKEYGIDRKTKIVDKWQEKEQTEYKAVKVEEKIDGNSIVFVNNDSVKRLDEGSLAKASEGYRKYEVPNSGELLAFTNAHKVFKYPIIKIKKGNVQKVDTFKKIAKKMDAGESIIFVTPLMKDQKICIIFDNQKAVKFPMSVYETVGNTLCFKKGYCDKASAIEILAIDKDQDIEINGKTINTANIKETGSRTSNGNKIKI